MLIVSLTWKYLGLFCPYPHFLFTTAIILRNKKPCFHPQVNKTCLIVNSVDTYVNELPHSFSNIILIHIAKLLYVAGEWTGWAKT